MRAASARAEARARFRLRLLIVFLLALTIAYARQFAVSSTAGQDFRVFYAAAQVAKEGASPYDWGALARAEDRLYNAPSHLQPRDPAYFYFLAFPEGPWLAAALEPLTALPWQAAFAAFDGLLLAAITGGALLCGRSLGWTTRRRRLAALCVILSPIGFLNLFMGQVSALVFFGLAGAWAFARGGRPILGGLLLTLSWIKPNIGLPLCLVVMLLQPAVARRILAGFVGGTAVAFLYAFAWLGQGFFAWPLQVPRMWQAVQGPQPDISSLESFFFPGLSGPGRTVALALALALAAAYGWWAVRRAHGDNRGLSLLLLWLAALPFVQSYDLVLLTPVVLTLLRPDGSGWRDHLLEATVWAFALFPFLYFLGARIGFFNGFTAIPVAMLVVAWHRSALKAGRPAAVQGAAA